MKKSKDATRKLHQQAERLVAQLQFLASSAEAAYTMTEQQLDGLALSLGHALDDAEALANTIELMQQGPDCEIVTPFPSAFSTSAETSEASVMRQKIHATCKKVLIENHKNNGHSAGKMSQSDVA